MNNERIHKIRTKFNEMYGNSESYLGGKITDNIFLTLSYARIFNVELIGDGTYAWFEEDCDNCFGYPINKSEMTQLICELTALRDKMKG